MKIINLFVILLLLIFIVGCTQEVKKQTSPTVLPEKSDIVPVKVEPKPFTEIDYSVEKQDCLSKGGNWTEAKPTRPPYCVIYTSDGGKECTDSKQCESNSCIAENKDSNVGKCSNVMGPKGCRYYFTNGKIDAHQLCAD